MPLEMPRGEVHSTGRPRRVQGTLFVRLIETSIAFNFFLAQLMIYSAGVDGLENSMSFMRWVVDGQGGGSKLQLVFSSPRRLCDERHDIRVYQL